MEEGGSGIYAFVKGRPTPRPPPATGLQVLLRQLEPEGHRDPPLSVLGLSPLHLSVSQPQEAECGHPFHTAGFSPRLSAALPRAGGAGPGPLVQASEGQWAPWLGRRSSAAGRQAHTPLITRGQRGTWAERGGAGHGA